MYIRYNKCEKCGIPFNGGGCLCANCLQNQINNKLRNGSNQKIQEESFHTFSDLFKAYKKLKKRVDKLEEENKKLEQMINRYIIKKVKHASSRNTTE